MFRPRRPSYSTVLQIVFYAVDKAAEKAEDVAEISCSKLLLNVYALDQFTSYQQLSNEPL